MPDYTYPKNFYAVAGANPSGWYDAAKAEYFCAYGFYQEVKDGPKIDEGAHVFRRAAGSSETVDVPLPELRPPNRGLLCAAADGGLELRSHRSPYMRCVIPIPDVAAPIIQGAPGPRGPAGPSGQDTDARRQASAATNMAHKAQFDVDALKGVVATLKEAIAVLQAAGLPDEQARTLIHGLAAALVEAASHYS